MLNNAKARGKYSIKLNDRKIRRNRRKKEVPRASAGFLQQLRIIHWISRVLFKIKPSILTFIINDKESPKTVTVVFQIDTIVFGDLVRDISQKWNVKGT